MDMGIHRVTSIRLNHKECDSGMKFSKVLITEVTWDGREIEHELTLFPNDNVHLDIPVQTD